MPRCQNGGDFGANECEILRGHLFEVDGDVASVDCAKYETLVIRSVGAIVSMVHSSGGNHLASRCALWLQDRFDYERVREVIWEARIFEF